MKLNTNISSLKVLNNAGKNDTRLEKSLEKLSSGLKINKAADNATGLAISRKMQVQIDALGKAQDKANDGISLIQTAEGALNEVHSILQRMKELSVQASNGTLSDDDRDSLQSEVTMLSDEIDRISTTIQFNSMNLLDGSISNKSYPSDENIGQVIQLSDGVNAGTYKYEVLNLATKTSCCGNQMSTSLFNDEGKLTTSGTIYINGAEIELTTNMTEQEVMESFRDAAEKSDLTFSTSTGDLSTFDTSVNPPVNVSRIILEADIAGEEQISASGNDSLLYMFGLNNLATGSTNVDSYEIPQTELTTNMSTYRGQTVNINGTEFTITDQINTFEDLLNKIKETGIAGAQFADNDTTWTFDAAFLTLNATDTASSALASKLDEILNTNSTKTNYPDGTNLLNGLVGRDVEAQITSWDDPTSGKVIGYPKGTTISYDGNYMTFTGPNGFKMMLENQGKLGECEMIITNSGALDLQIGANEGQTLSIKIPNMGTKAIGIENLNVRTQGKAEETITRVDNAIEKVSEVRAKLGAFNNRIDYTINSLTETEQNLTESLSRIQDTDMAEEMSEYTQADILSEASMTILAQANQRPQGLLTLLQNMI